MSYSINIIGAGRIGQVLARLFVLNNIAQLNAVCNRSLESGKLAIDFIGEGTALADVSELPTADMTFITTPDDVIASCAQQLAENSLKPGSIIVHCCGAKPADILKPVKKHDVLIASAHPLFSFGDRKTSLEQFAGAYVSLDGDKEACDHLQTLFAKLGAHTFMIDSRYKTNYHIGAVFASNFLPLLTHAATQCFQSANIDEETSRHITHKLMQNTLNNLQVTETIADALTGPLKRGDSALIEQHIASLENTDLHDLYITLTNASKVLVD